MSDNHLLDKLTTFICDEVYKALGLNISGSYRRIIDPLLHLPAKRFCKIALEFDRQVEQHGFVHAACSILPNFVRGVDYYGMDTVPKGGPLLVVSNHPGTVDGLCIAAGLARDDIKIVASGMPFIRGLQASASNFIYSSLDTYERMLVIRSGIKHLKKGGTVLLFPSGHLDPDPEILPGVEDGLREWSPSVDLMLKKVPQAQVLVTIVQGVLSRRNFDNPFTRIRKTLRDRQRIAEFIQVTRQMILGIREDLTPKVIFAPPASVPDLVSQANGTSLVPVLIHRAQNLLPIQGTSIALNLDRC